MAAKKAPAKKKKKGGDEEHENSERWLLTYADMITLLMLFFIVLYAMSPRDPKKFEDLAQTFQTVFQGANMGFVFSASNSVGTKGEMLLGRQQTDPSKTLREKRNALMSQLEYRMKNIMPQNQYKVTEVQEGIKITLFSDTFFDPGSPEVHPEAVPFLGKVADGIKALPNAIRVEGHTDGSTMEGDKFSKEWQLSTERALSVLNLFLSYGYPEEKSGVAGYGSTRPVATNSTPEGQAFNRRVDVLLLWDKSQM
jgi:chemotaxis protein MotB